VTKIKLIRSILASKGNNACKSISVDLSETSSNFIHYNY